VTPARGGAVGRVVGAVVASAATGGFALLWTFMTPIFIRATFRLSNLRAPQIAAIYPLQAGGWLIAVVGLIAGLIVLGVRGSSGLFGRDPSPMPEWWGRREVVIGRTALVAGLLTVVMVGVFSAPWQAGLVF